MPPRPVVWAILLFWATTTGWLLYREAGPYLGAGAPPAYTVDLTEQLSKSPVTWHVLMPAGDGPPAKVGYGTTHVERGDGETFELKADFKFDRLVLANTLAVRKVVGSYRVTEAGHLRGLAGEVVGGLGKPTDPHAPEVQVVFRGAVADGFLTPGLSLAVAGQAFALPALQKVAVSENGSVLNPMHPLHRLPRLREGQRWTIPLFNPLTALGDGVLGGLTNQAAAIPELHALVVADTLLWGADEVACLVIEYREPGKDVTARTWAHRGSGLVLQQWASHGGQAVTLQRAPERLP